MDAWQHVHAALLALAALALLTTSVCHVLVWMVVRRRPAPPRAGTEAVSVLKPLCGVDGQLRENLDVFARQTHRELQVILGVASVEDDAWPVAAGFLRDHPRLDAHVSVGENRGPNPKIALLDRMRERARGDWVVVSDSNVRVDPDYVQRSIGYAGENVGLITHLVAGGGETSSAAALENLQLNCFVAPAVCGARFIAGRTCVVGKSMFVRREALDAVGGFRSVGGYLAEDYAMGVAVERAGYRVITADEPVLAWHVGWTVSRFFNRHLRWAVMRRSVSRLAYGLEAFLTPGPLLCVLLSLAMSLSAPPVRAAWIGLGLALEALLVAITYARMSGRAVSPMALVLNPVREWLTLGIWVAGWFVHQIEWRGTAYHVGRDSVLEPVAPPLAESLPDEA